MLTITKNGGGGTFGPALSLSSLLSIIVVEYDANRFRKRRLAMNTLASVVFAAVLSVGSLSLARADQPGPDWMPAQQVIEQVLKSGYTQVTQLEADDGRWEGEGIKNGQKMDFHADPKTGVITFEKLDD
jgi:hypothetical protein